MSPNHSRDELVTLITAIVCECGELLPGELAPEESFHRRGLDSLVTVHIAYELGLLVDQDVPAEMVNVHDSVEKLVAYVLAVKEGAA